MVTQAERERVKTALIVAGTGAAAWSAKRWAELRRQTLNPLALQTHLRREVTLAAEAALTEVLKNLRHDPTVAADCWRLHMGLAGIKAAIMSTTASGAP